MANTHLIYLNQTIPVPRITSIEEDPEPIGEGNRTVMGTYRYDAIDYKNIYKVEANYLLPAEYNLINDHIIAVKGGLTEFWIQDFGGDSTTDSVLARIEITNVERVQFGRNGVWYNDGRNLEFKVTIA